MILHILTMLINKANQNRQVSENSPMERKWFAKPQRRNNIILKTKLHSETHFTTKSYFSIPRYKLCYTNYPDGTVHGGTAIFIKETIVYYELLKYEEDFNQATSIKVKGFPHEITITAVYCPPRHNLK